MLPCNSPEFHDLVERQAYAFSDHLIKHKETTKYDVHGLFGIFGRGDRIGNSSKRYRYDYKGVKTSFMLEWACRVARTTSVNTICEVGFCAGLSALLLLEAAPQARVVSFDLGDFPWSRYANNRLKELYSPERFPGVIFGDSAVTIPRAVKTQELRCDMVFVDGDKRFEGRLKTLYDLRMASKNGTIVFMDEVTSKECVDGSITSSELEQKCALMNWGYWPSVKAYNVAVHKGWLHVQRCARPRGVHADGLCMGVFI